jgi:hypothetical protein
MESNFRQAFGFVREGAGSDRQRLRGFGSVGLKGACSENWWGRNPAGIGGWWVLMMLEWWFTQAGSEGACGESG